MDRANVLGAGVAVPILVQTSLQRLRRSVLVEAHRAGSIGRQQQKPTVPFQQRLPPNRCSWCVQTGLR
jgi:hypothetical protein